MKNKIYLLLVLILLGVFVKLSYGQTDERPDYFICQYWEDKNGDGILDNDEFIGIKDTFDATNDSLITFVGYYYNEKGSEIAIKIYDPDDNLYSEDSAVVEYEPTHVHRWWFHPSTLVEDAGTGDWTAYWYLSGNLVHTETFTLTDWLGDFSDLLSEDSSKTEQRDFFACNYWEDKNGDTLMGRDEYVGVKDTFSVEDDSVIAFVSYWHSAKGKNAIIKLYDPQGYFWISDSGKIMTDEYVFQWPYYVMTMAEEGGLGNWTAKWYLDGNYANEITINIYKKFQSTYLKPQFFTCKYWSDLNKDGYIASDNSEFIGIKDTFQVDKDSTIAFVSHWFNKTDMVAKIEIYTPADSEWKTKNSTLTSDNRYWFPSYYTKSMYDAGGTGVWTVKWYLNDEFITSKDFTIVKP
jgi:hypothetical protein